MAGAGKADYLSRLGERINGLERSVPSFLGRKSEVRQFAKYVGVKVPETYFVGTRSELSLDALPDEFVLKPDFASTSMGVHLLERRDGQFFDLASDSLVEEDKIVEALDGVAKRYYDDIGKAVYRAEELLRDYDGSAPPPDFRFYMFQGIVGMIVRDQHMSGKTQLMYFDSDFLPFSDVENRYSIAEGCRHLDEIVEAVVPTNWRAIKAVAERVSRAVPSPFVRVDLYDTPKGVYLGELTFYPGPYYYGNRKLMSASESERLGRLWAEAEARLGLEVGMSQA